MFVYQTDYTVTSYLFGFFALAYCHYTFSHYLDLMVMRNCSPK